MPRSSCRVPLCAVRPARMMLTRSQSASTSARMWLDSSTVRPSAFTSRMQSWKTASISGSSPEVGSSRMSSSARRRERRDQRRPSGGCPSSRCAPSSSGRARSARAARRGGAGRGRRAAGRAGRSPRRRSASATSVTSPGHVREPAVQRDRVAPRVAAEQPARARVGADEAEQHPDRRRLARAVRPEEAVHLARLRRRGRGRRARASTRTS